MLFLTLASAYSEVVAYSLILPTGSMEPTLTAGDRVELFDYDGQLQDGQIIAFMRGDTLVMHRVFAQPFGCIITKGDALILPDWGCQTPVYEAGQIIR